MKTQSPTLILQSTDKAVLSIEVKQRVHAKPLLVKNESKEMWIRVLRMNLIMVIEWEE